MITVDDNVFFNQAKNVLRFEAGDKLILCDSEKNEAMTQIISYSKNSVNLEILEIRKNENEPKNYVILYCPILKKENFELVVQKAVEVGVKEITPIITKRTVKLGLNYERLNKIIKEAAEQSGRGILPKINEVLSFEKAMEKAKSENDLNLFFNIGETPLGHPMSKWGKIGIFVGPEGGWDDEEAQIAKDADLTFASLGKLTLRAETAAIVASYMACNL